MGKLHFRENDDIDSPILCGRQEGKAYGSYSLDFTISASLYERCGSEQLCNEHFCLHCHRIAYKRIQSRK